MLGREAALLNTTPLVILRGSAVDETPLRTDRERKR
jgi:hypothetical protein